MAPKRKKPKWYGDPLRPAAERGETLLTKREAADYLGVRLRFMTSEAAREIPRVMVGRYVRYRKADLDAYIEAQRVSAGR
jgi:excisionase family DNA binding protein